MVIEHPRSSTHSRQNCGKLSTLLVRGKFSYHNLLLNIHNHNALQLCGSSYQLASKLRCCKIEFFPFSAFLFFKIILVPPISSWLVVQVFFKGRTCILGQMSLSFILLLFFLWPPCATLNRIFSLLKNHQCQIFFRLSLTLSMTYSQNRDTLLCRGVTKNLTTSRMKKNNFKKIPFESLWPELSNDVYYIVESERFGREKQFSSKNCLKSSFFEGHKMGSTDFEQP